ncbi:MAG TPA: rod shape-determining protein MreC [Tissierellales bacterium]|nr:rod shape-determining protein MreC [Tissierellales bacterium]
MNMSIFKKYKSRMVVTAVAIILIITMGMTNSGRKKMTKTENVFGNVFEPVEKFFYNTGQKFAGFFGSIGNIGKLKSENEELKKKIAALEDENRKYEDVIGKSDFLRMEAELFKNTKHDLISAQVIGKEPGNWFNRFKIDKGSNDGIKKDDIVVQGVERERNVYHEGVIGRVVEVGEDWAKVTSIVDESSNISFKITRTQDGGMLSGNVDGELNGYLFESKADVTKGDKLMTSGLGGGYIKDLYIGDVKEVIKKDDDLMERVIISPAVDFKKIYKVYIISNK